jgi:hypothetical protein
MFYPFLNLPLFVQKVDTSENAPFRRIFGVVGLSGRVLPAFAPSFPGILHHPARFFRPYWLHAGALRLLSQHHLFML